MPRTIAVDWSGAKSGARRAIYLAEVRDARLTRLESGRTREQLIDHLIEDAARDPDVVVGLDFAFSFPAWFVRMLGADSAEALWAEVGRQGEDWLKSCEPPFWGRPRKKKPDLREHFRRTEQAAAEVAHATPKSVFQIGGAGAVGTGSVRGMPHLARLRAAGFSVWPFHLPGRPTVVEIYPRLLTGRVTKSDADSRREYLAAGFPEIGDDLRDVAIASEDAFDAAVSAVVMARHVDELAGLGQASDPVERLEGRIWWP